jgi:hypothetical protein
MKELTNLLNSAIETNTDPKLVEVLKRSQQLAEQQVQENQRLEKIISDIRKRDAQKNCLCRGIG